MSKQTIPVRLDDELVVLIDELAAELSTRAVGLEVTRSDVLRLALARGLEVVRGELREGSSARIPKPKKGGS